jgi:hypothetical protein
LQAIVSADTESYPLLSNNLIGDTAMKHIYVYTTASYRLKKWYKIGETSADPKIRVQAQDNASNPEALILIESWVVPEWVTDGKVHAILRQFGFKNIRKEWFALSQNPQNDVFLALCKITNLIKTQPIDSEAFYSTINVPNYTEMWWFQKS